MRIPGAMVVLVCAAAVAATPDSFASPRGGPSGPHDIRPVAVVARDRAAARSGHLAFAVDLYGKAVQGSGNVVISPLSLCTTLEMLSQGAAGETRRELVAALRSPLPPARQARASQDVLARISASSREGARVAVANGVFVGSELHLRKRFESVLTRRFGALSHPFEDPAVDLDFVNAWGSERTGGLVPRILPESSAPGPVTLVLANAVRFEGEWELPFPTRTDGPFQTLDSGVVTTKLMRAEGGFRAAFGDGYRAVDVPYRGGEFALRIVVPDDFAEFEAALSPAAFDSAAAEFDDAWLSLEMPPFAVTSSRDLEDPLRALGVHLAWDEDLADFSRAIDDHATGALQVVRQEAHVRVDEEGTVAAAVTVTGLDLGQGQGLFDRPEPFRVDRPFLFAVLHLRTGAILFLGRVTDPTR